MSFAQRLSITVVMGCAAALPIELEGADDYPSKPIRFIVPYVPGGGADITARIAAQKLTEILGSTVVVDNRPGAGGNLGTGFAAKSAPDGYTILLANVGPVAINVGLYKRLPYDPVKDFAPVSLMVVYPNVLVVHPSVPVKSIKELVALAKARPGQLTYASAGVGSSTHLAAELFQSLARIDMVHVPYKGGGQAIVDLVAGQVHMYFSSLLGALPHIKSGKLRALAVTSAKRSHAALELPTVAESGFPGFEADNWNGLLVPAGTPEPIVVRLNREIVRIFRQSDVQERLSALGGHPQTNSPEQFADYISSEIKKWSKVVKDSGARAE